MGDRSRDAWAISPKKTNWHNSIQAKNLLLDFAVTLFRCQGATGGVCLFRPYPSKPLSLGGMAVLGGLRSTLVYPGVGPPGSWALGMVPLSMLVASASTLGVYA